MTLWDSMCQYMILYMYNISVMYYSIIGPSRESVCKGVGLGRPGPREWAVKWLDLILRQVCNMKKPSHLPVTSGS